MSDDMRIKCAAILHDGKIYEGPSHYEIGTRMLAGGVCERPFPSGDAQGFATECGMFVRRKPAHHIATKAGQVSNDKSLLFSEDFELPEGIVFNWGKEVRRG